MRNKFLSLVLTFAMVFTIASCAHISGASFAGSYRLSGGELEQTSSSEEFISLGQKDSGSYIESYSLEFTAPSGKDIHIAYRSHIQDAGWCQWSPSGQEITYQQFYGIDTIQVFLYGKDALMYDVSYRVAVAGEDWQEWVDNGAMAGVPDQHRPIEAVEIRLELHEEYETPTWTITQFGDDGGSQSEFYTMRNNDDGTLIVIDGGWEANTAQVRSVIELLGGHADHWFLTHYDEDHASAFNAIYADPGDIEIGDVYGSLWLELAELYGERLQATYVQPGHHGNNYVAPESWDVTEAEVMLFDGPTWLTQSDDYSAKPLIEWCHENGIETYEFETAPNSFPFN